ncbi:MAG: sodium:solute symporter [Methylovirgula sp.]
MAMTIFIIMFLVVAAVGFLASRYKQASVKSLSEWGLGGRQFGAVMDWFLVGNSLYTAYTFVAVPALIFGVGAIGFFAVPYTIVCYPILFVFFPRLWRVAHKHGYVTASEYVRGRYGNRWLALAIGVTGIVATLPYIALQLVGTQVVISAVGFPGTVLPLVIAFVVVAAFTYSSGLRASALTSIVKGVLIYGTVFAAIIVIPMELGGFGAIFAKVPPAHVLLKAASLQNWGTYSAYGTLALGSAMALFIYPHAVTGLLASKNARVIEKNAMTLPAFTLLLGLLALLGFMAVAAGVGTDPAYAAGFKQYGPSYAIPAIIMKCFPSWFTGFAMAGIAIGGIVPASVMAIGSGNILTRDIWGEFVHVGTEEERRARETQIAKIFAMLMIAASLIFVFVLPKQFIIQFQLIGGVWIIQTFPAVALSLFWGRAFSGWSLFIGWLAGIVSGTWMVATLHFAGTTFNVHLFGITIPMYAALASFILNLVVTVILAAIFKAANVDLGRDETLPSDYTVSIAQQAE